VTAILVDGLAQLGLITSLAPGRPARGEGGTGAGALAAACFAVAYGHELVYAGRKICGSAQRRLTRAFLQHGSILLGPEQVRMAHFLRSDGDREALAMRLRAETVDVSSALGRPVEPDELAAALSVALESRFGARVVTGELPKFVMDETKARLESVRVIGVDNHKVPG
jgi:lipoate-protein ligase A